MMMKRESLADLTIGSSCKIASVELEGLLRRRVMDLGVLPGTKIQCVRKSPAGDPIAYRVRDTTIALRSDDAGRITVYSI